MLKIENVNNQKVYCIKNKYLCECGLLNEKNLCSCIYGLSCQTIRTNEKVHLIKTIYAYTIYPYGNCVTFQFIENDHRTFNSYSKKFMFAQLLRYYKKGLNNWIELYNNDGFKTKREKKRMNYYINKLNEFERLLND